MVPPTMFLLVTTIPQAVAGLESKDTTKMTETDTPAAVPMTAAVSSIPEEQFPLKLQDVPDTFVDETVVVACAVGGNKAVVLTDDDCVVAENEEAVDLTDDGRIVVESGNVVVLTDDDCMVVENEEAVDLTDDGRMVVENEEAVD
eukprot:Em0005g1576a